MENNQTEDFKVTYDELPDFDTPLNEGDSESIDDAQFGRGIDLLDDDYDKVSENEIESIEESNEPSFAPFIENLEASGLLYLDEDKEYDDSEEGLQEIIEDTIQYRIQETLNNIEDSRTQEAIEFMLRGGTLEEYQDMVGETDYSEYTEEDILNSPDSHVDLVYNYLESLGTMNEEQINSKISKFIEKDMLQEEAVTAFEHLRLIQQQEKEDAFQNLEVRREEERIENIRMYEELEREIVNTREIKGLEITPLEAKQLHVYMTRPVNKEGNTQYQVDIASDLENTLFSAYATMKKLDAKKLTIKGETEASKKLRNELSKFNDGRSKDNSTKAGNSNKNGDIRKDEFVDLL